MADNSEAGTKSRPSAPEDEGSEGEGISPLRKQIDWFMSWEEETRTDREDMARDRDYYDGDQWSEDDIATLKARKQPPVVINRIAKKINVLLGNEVRSRVDPTSLPRTPVHEDDASVVASLIRYTTDKERFNQRIKGPMADNLFVEGLCGAMVRPERMPDESIEVKYSQVEWDRMYWDPFSRKANFSDGIYRGIFLWMDVEEAITKYAVDGTVDGEKVKGSGKEIEELLRNTLNHSFDESETTDDKPEFLFSDRRRRRVRVFETYWNEGEKVMTAHWVINGFLVKPQRIRWRDDRDRDVNPLVMTSAFVRKRDNARYGFVRNMIWPQDEVNKRRSSMIHALVQNQIIAEETALPDIKAAKREKAKPDGTIIVADGALSSGAVDFPNNSEITQGHAAMLQEAKAEIDTIGPDTSNVTGLPESTSGRAFIARQQASNMELEPVMDNFRELELKIYEITWYLSRQLTTEEKWLRIRDDEKGIRFVGLNRKMTKFDRLQDLVSKAETPLPEAINEIAPELTMSLGPITQAAQQQIAQFEEQSGQHAPPQMAQQLVMQQLSQAPQLQEQFTENDIAKIEVDIRLSVAPDTAILQQEQFDTFANNFVEPLLQLGIDPLGTMRMLLELSSFTAKKEALELLDNMEKQQAQKGQPDPAAQQAQQMQLQQLQIQMAALQAEVQKTQMQTENIQADTQLKAAETEKNQAQALKAAAEAGEKSGTSLG